ncbi:MAG: M48 family metalloprotease [Desulfurivibrionaceae bacterium]|nr:M48 family metalloprotease [Desulfurivibrionaceae bacterium]
MSYNNLLYLLVVIFLLSVQPISAQPALPLWQVCLLFAAKFALFHFCCRLFFAPSRVRDVRKYLRAEKHLILLAIFFVAIDIFLLDCLSYFARLPYVGILPFFSRFLGLLLFFAYLGDVWFVASSRSGAIFGRTTHARGFVLENIRSNLPIILPWFCISLLLDLLHLLPMPAVQTFMASGLGEVIVLLLFFLFIALIFPPLLLRIWGCRPMAAGPFRDHMVAFCQRLNLHYQDIMIWPLFGGQMVTAGVVGFIARFRYILVTPGLLANLETREIDAVLAHEIGHVKRHHMPLYLLILVGFSIIMSPFLELFLYATLQGEWFYRLAAGVNLSASGLLDIILPVALLVLLVLFLRFVFGFFMRNFERQADLHALTALGGGSAISAALEKVAWLSGDIRELPSWHHFGIRQRVDFLAACDADPALVQRHHRKVYLALGFYCALIITAGMVNYLLPKDLVEQAVSDRAVARLEEEISQAPDNYQIPWALGDLYLQQKAYGLAIAAYERSLRLAPENPEVLNNLAWLLVTCEEKRFRDGQRGLLLASKAADLKPAPHILDTLAHAYWLQGEKKQALATEKKALDAARPEHKGIYAEQLKKWQESLQEREGQGADL